MAEAARLLELSVRHRRRLRRAYRLRGAAALAHGNRGRPSPRRLPDSLRQRIVRLARTTYATVNHQHLTELLREREGLRVSRQSVSRLLHQAGLPSPRRRRPPKHRTRRERMPQEGMLVQLRPGDEAQSSKSAEDKITGRLGGQNHWSATAELLKPCPQSSRRYALNAFTRARVVRGERPDESGRLPRH